MRRCFSAFVGGEGSITSQVSGARFAGSAESKVCKNVVPVRGNPTTKEERESGAARFQVADSGRVAAKAGCVKCGEYPNAVRCFRPRLGARLPSTTQAA